MMSTLTARPRAMQGPPCYQRLDEDAVTPRRFDAGALSFVFLPAFLNSGVPSVLFRLSSMEVRAYERTAISHRIVAY
jgi:hypothetical protein